jgi:hypothetical protein
MQAKSTDYRRETPSFFARDPESGYTLLWQPDTSPGSVKPLSRFVILNKGGDQIGLVPVPTGIKTGRELAQLFKEHNVEFPVASAYVKVATEDEERIQRILSVWGRSLELTKGTPGPVPGPQVLKGEVTPAYFRTLAKIGFHYVLTHIPTIVGNEPKFHPLREFIRFGTGDPRRFVHRLNKAPNTNGPPGHVLAAIAVPDNITVNMQFLSAVKSPYLSGHW